MTIKSGTQSFESPFTTDGEAVVYLQARILGGDLRSIERVARNIIATFFSRGKMSPAKRMLLHRLAATEKNSQMRANRSKAKA